MSLDVSLYLPPDPDEPAPLCPHCDQPMPPQRRRVFDSNITGNLAPMAGRAGIYKCLWRPEEAGINTAAQLVEPLRAGLLALHAEPARFTPLNPSNGWGSYEALVEFVAEYLAACEAYPGAAVEASR